MNTVPQVPIVAAQGAACQGRRDEYAFAQNSAEVPRAFFSKGWVLKRPFSCVLIAAFVLMLAPVSAADSAPPALASFKVPGATPASQKLIDEDVAMLYRFNRCQPPPHLSPL